MILNIFIDGGGNHYSGVEKYLKMFPPFNHIYVFEPNPFFHNSYNESNIKLIKKAIWTTNCMMPLYISKDEKQISSSLFEEKLCKINFQLVENYWYDQPIQVECIDFSEWLKNNIQSNYNVTLKLDIEGAEYEVLDKLINDGTIKYINKLYVEFHQDTIKSKQQQHNYLMKLLKSSNIEVFDWD